MNCKQGDLAIIVGANDPEYECNIGATVFVLEAFPWPDIWKVRVTSVLAAEQGHAQCHTEPGEIVLARDCDLRPIRGDSQHTDEPERIKVEA